MMKLGYNTAGTEAKFEEMLREQMHLAMLKEEPFNYLEVGIAEGTTLRAVADLCEECKMEKWNAIGFDLADGPFFNPKEFLQKTRHHDVEILYNGNRRLPQVIDASPNHRVISVCLMREDENLSDSRFENLHFVLIDGCHGAACVMRDFRTVAPWVIKGGMVAFHDAMAEDQGGAPGTNGWQSHCKEGINVMGAIASLAMQHDLDGWKPVAAALGDKTANPPGNGFMFYRKEKS